MGKIDRLGRSKNRIIYRLVEVSEWEGQRLDEDRDWKKTQPGAEFRHRKTTQTRWGHEVRDWKNPYGLDEVKDC
jgi:hypothetical protein